MNILLDKLDFHQPWAYETFKNIIKPDHKVCIIPFAFHEDWIKDAEQWESLYNKHSGGEYLRMITPFYAYRISDDNVTLINYFTDNSHSAKEKINESNIIFFTGGFPEKTMRRLKEFDLIETLENHPGIKMGWSAGTMMQCEDYYISPDDDYPEFVYEKGLSYVKDFAVEVHYKNTESQNKSIERYMAEKGKRVYTTEPESAIIVNGNEVALLGNAKLYKGLS
ncbi:peptidase E [Clostridium punense]|uniref:Peptidase E n=2 Tax=Clostridium TaxID=1485 RepID=A0ABS4K4A9_9CLOT|nr:peptidase E [Clostridium punense]